MGKIERSIELIRKAEPLALKMSPDGFHLAFSGGKDSQVIYELCKMAGVKFKPVMQVTTIDPPELMKFVRKNYPDVILERPDINFYKLIIKKKLLPTMIARYCCHYLKEQSGGGTITILGIRREESIRRSNRNEIEIQGNKYSNSLDQFNIDVDKKVLCVTGKDKIMLLPIAEWTKSDVWRFIRSNGLEYCELYDRGYHRIGCVFCPMASVKTKQLDRKNYPGIEKAIKKAIQTLIDTSDYGKCYGMDADDLFNWWISNDSQSKYMQSKNQQKIEFNYA